MKSCLALTLATFLALVISACGSSSSAGADAGVDDGGTPDAGVDAGTPPRCALGASCTAADKSCIGLASNSGQTKFGLRMSEVDILSPHALTTGIVSNVIGGAVSLNEPSCNQHGGGTFSWLVQFDTVAQTLKTGGARPASDPSVGYSFDTETVGTLQVQPVTFAGVAQGATGQFSIAAGMDLVLPIFLDAAGNNSILLPLHQARFPSVTLSSSNDCIGQYNADGLDPANSCQPASSMPGFIDGGSFDGYITLEEADSVIITTINSSLCVLLSGNATMYGTPGASGASVCKRDSSNKILYQGGWCSATNAAAAAGCADAEEFKGNFAASSIKILN